MKPFGNKCILQIAKVYQKENGKPVINEDGTQRYDLEQEGRVLSSNIEGVKKGMKVLAAFRAGMPITRLENKNSVTVIFEESDIYATE